METRNMLKTGNQQSALIPELRKHQDAHWHVEILLKWETQKIRKERKFDTWTTNENTSVEI